MAIPGECRSKGVILTRKYFPLSTAVRSLCHFYFHTNASEQSTIRFYDDTSDDAARLRWLFLKLSYFLFGLIELFFNDHTAKLVGFVISTAGAGSNI